MARPVPHEAPVTRAVFPLNSPVMFIAGSFRLQVEGQVCASAIADLSANQRSLQLFNALAANPLQNVWRAVPHFDFLVLTVAEKTN